MSYKFYFDQFCLNLSLNAYDLVYKASRGFRDFGLNLSGLCKKRVYTPFKERRQSL